MSSRRTRPSTMATSSVATSTWASTCGSDGDGRARGGVPGSPSSPASGSHCMGTFAWSVRILSAFACLAAAACLPAYAGADAVRLEREISIDGRPLHYVAEAGRLPLLHAVDGAPRAWIFHTGYRSPAGWGARPITFLWNGGPVSNSVLLHFDGFGPRLVRDGALVDNPHTLLTHSDLVFMDPVGTGYSRAAAGHADDFASTRGDFIAATQFVRSFLIAHGALDAPVYLAGESYGVWRAAAAAGQLAE